MIARREVLAGLIGLLICGLGNCLEAQQGKPANAKRTVSDSAEALPAFPGAEGFGADTTHARGKPVFHVTRLDDEDVGPKYLKPGYFRRALHDAKVAGGGYIVFDVAGVIHLSREALIPSHTYVAGQSAPGSGIAIEGAPVQIGTRDEAVHDVVIRHIRHRGNFRKKGSDAFAVYWKETRRVVIDHVSVSFFQDGAVDITGGAEEVTVQWSHLGDAADSKTDEPYHGEPHLISYGSNRVTLHHNFYTHTHSRVPLMSKEVDHGLIEFSNNVVYNYRKYPSTLESPGGRGNVLGNLYVAGINTHANESGQIRPLVFGSGGFQAYLNGNFALGGMGHDNRDKNGQTFKGRDQHVMRGRPVWVEGARESEDVPEIRLLGTSQGRTGTVPGIVEAASTRFDEIPPVAITPVPENAVRVLRLFGALPHDRTDARLLAEFIQRTGEWKMEPPKDENEYHGDRIPDQDHDGLPDAFEAQHKKDLKPNGHDLHPVYDNIEVYLQQRSTQLEEEAPPLELTWNDILKASRPPAGVKVSSGSSVPAPPASLPVTPSSVKSESPAETTAESMPASQDSGKPTEAVVRHEQEPTVVADRNARSPVPSPSIPDSGPPSVPRPEASPAATAPAPPSSAGGSMFPLVLLWLAGVAGVAGIAWAGLRSKQQSPVAHNDVYPVTGRLVFGETCPAGALVVLHPLKPPIEVHPRATVKADGSFEISTYGQGDGAPAGEYRLTVAWHKPVQVQGQPSLSANRFPSHLAHPETTDLNVTVSPGINLLPPIKIQA